MELKILYEGTCRWNDARSVEVLKHGSGVRVRMVKDGHPLSVFLDEEQTHELIESLRDEFQSTPPAVTLRENESVDLSALCDRVTRLELDALVDDNRISAAHNRLNALEKWRNA